MGSTVTELFRQGGALSAIDPSCVASFTLKKDKTIVEIATESRLTQIVDRWAVISYSCQFALVN
jgi:hypothetical protein